MRRWLHALSSGTAIHLSFAAALAIVAFVCFTLWRAAGESRAAAESVVHTQEVLQTLADARESFARVESAQRAFLLTGAQHYLADREESTARLHMAIASVESLTSDNPNQHARVEQLAAAARERLAIAGEVGRARQQEGLAGLAPAPLERAQQASERFYAQAADMQAAEQRLLAQRQAVDLQRQRATSWVIGGAFAVFLIVLLPAYGAITYQARRREGAERQMTQLVGELPATVWQLLTRAGRPPRYVYVGPHAQRDRGFAPERLLADANLVFSNVVDEDRDMVRRTTEEAEGRGIFECEYRVRLDEGGIRWIRSSAHLQPRPDGATLWTGYWTDISAQKALEQALQDATDEANRASRAKSTFLATMSHEIRTPMNGVLGLLELLNLTRLDSEQRATLNVVCESGRALLRIIDDILDFSKVEAGRLTLDPVPAKVADVVDRACQIYSGIASSRGLLLQQQVDARISPVLLFDPLRVGQILNNFISNALKFTREGSVTVAVRSLSRTEDTERLRFEVRDTGIGIPADLIGHLFEPFAQADAQTVSRFGGTGLGLAICRRLAQMMDGEVTLSSEAGAGTVAALEVAFPVGSPEQVLQAAERAEAPRQLTRTVAARRIAPSAADAESEGRLVLVVDDHPTNRLVLSRQVAALGYGLLMAEDGTQALEAWRTRRVALVLTDCNMPGLNGYELTRTIRTLEAEQGRPRVPVIACTANALDNEGARCLAAGMDDILIKPVNLIDLMACLDRWLPLPGEAPHTEAPVPEQPGLLLDTAVLDAITGGDPQVRREVLLDFRHVNEADLAVLRSAMAGAEDEQLLQLAHRIKGAARTVGAQRVTAACERLEQAVRRQERTSTTRAFADLEEEVMQLDRHIDAVTAAGSSA